MPGLNKVQLIGRLGKDPELRSFENGSKVCSFSLATDEQWKDKVTGEKKTRVEWHNVVVWGSLADICSKYLKKGSQIFVEGKLRTRDWEKDGIKRYTTEVFVDDMLMLGSKDDRPAQAAPPVSAQHAPAQQQQGSSTPADQTDDLPF